MTNAIDATGMTSADNNASDSGRTVWSILRRRVGFWLAASCLVVVTLVAAFPGLFAGMFGNGDPRACDLSLSGMTPQSGHPFGTDIQGCDIWANVMYGTRASLLVGLLTTSLSVVVALILGTAAGWWGGWVDAILARINDIFLGFPFLLGAVVMLNAIGGRDTFRLSMVLAAFGWPTMARLVRGSVRSVRDADFVNAARVMGLSTWRILVRYVIPTSFGPLLALATVAIGGVIVAESTLTFLGLGLQAPAISLGLQLATAQPRMQQMPHLLVFPSIMLSLMVISLIVLGDMLRDALDPRSR